MAKMLLTFGELLKLNPSMRGNQFRVFTSTQIAHGPMGHMERDRKGNIAFLHGNPNQQPQCFLTLTREEQEECRMIVMPSADQVVIHLPRIRKKTEVGTRGFLRLTTSRGSLEHYA